jgi:hydroxyacylglutathione hydrolase
MIHTETIVTGPIEENAYIVYNEDEDDAIVIDPGADSDEIIGRLGELERKAHTVLLTHGHYDHIGAVQGLRDRYGVQVMIHEDDADMLTNPEKNMSALFLDGVRMQDADRLLVDGDILRIAGMEVHVIHTPGHTQGSVCFLIENQLFSGDTLFEGTVGRTDFPGSSWEQMERSLAALYALPGDYKVFSGHGPMTMLEKERRTNPWMRG